MLVPNLMYYLIPDVETFTRIQRECEVLGYPIVHTASAVFVYQDMTITYGVIVVQIPPVVQS